MTAAEPLVEFIHVVNFACLRDVKVPLTRLHAFIGPNDSGKSTLLRALRTAVHLSTSTFESDGKQIRPFPPGFEQETGIFLRLSHGTRYRLSVGHDTMLTESVQWAGRDERDEQEREWLHVAGKPLVLGIAATGPRRLRPFIERLTAGARFMHLAPRTLREPGGLIPEDGRREFIDEYGAGLPGILDAVLNRGDDSFLKIVDAVCRLFPTIRGVRLRPISRDTKVIEFELTSGARVQADFASEGLLFYLAFAALQFLDPVGLLLVEEPENGLHPARIVDIMRILREISQTTQVVLATHSPLVINEMQGNEVTLVTRDPDKGTQVKLLSETPHFAERSKVYALGELWLSYANGVDEAALLRDESVP